MFKAKYCCWITSDCRVWHTHTWVHSYTYNCTDPFVFFCLFVGEEDVAQTPPLWFHRLGRGKISAPLWFNRPGRSPGELSPKDMALIQEYLDKHERYTFCYVTYTLLENLNLYNFWKKSRRAVYSQCDMSDANVTLAVGGTYCTMPCDYYSVYVCIIVRQQVRNGSLKSTLSVRFVNN